MNTAITNRTHTLKSLSLLNELAENDGDWEVELLMRYWTNQFTQIVSNNDHEQVIKIKNAPGLHEA